MTKVDNSKRTFFKKAAAAVGFVAAAGYLRNLMPGRTHSIQAINDSSEADVTKQKKVWLEKQWEPMTDNDKKQMLDEILATHDQYHA